MNKHTNIKNTHKNTKTKTYNNNKKKQQHIIQQQRTKHQQNSRTQKK